MTIVVNDFKYNKVFYYNNEETANLFIEEIKNSNDGFVNLSYCDIYVCKKINRKYNLVDEEKYYKSLSNE